MPDPLEIYYKTLDKLFPGWETRQDDYYLVELSFLIRCVYGNKETDETVIKNLRKSEVQRYQGELNQILATPNVAIAWILAKRLNADRAKACKTRYIDNLDTKQTKIDFKE